MFGYVRPLRPELRIRDYDAYHAAYCGLCRALAKRYGFRSRFLVNYDMTFLYLVRASVRPAAPTRRCFCPARPGRKKPCLCDDDGFARVAACTVVLCYCKILDNIRDSGFWKGLACRFLMRIYRRPWRKAEQDAPEFAALVRTKLRALSELEAAKSPGMDAAADTFAAIVAACADDLPDEAIRRPAQALLYQVGRHVYLCDALDDLAEDLRTDGYNPLRYRFAPTQTGLSDEDLAYLSQIMDSGVNLAGAALSLLPVRQYGPLLENVVYLGLPAVFAAVKTGRFRADAKEFPRKENPS